MTVCEILRYIRYMANKPQKGNALSPQEYNLSLQDANVFVFNDELSKFNTGDVIPEVLRRFLTPITAGTITAGVYTLPSDFAEIATVAFTVSVGGAVKLGRFVSDSAASRMRTSTVYKLQENPIAVMRSGTVQVYPTNAADFQFQYLREPLQPVYDYYMDANLNEVCLAYGQSYTLGAGETGSDGTTSGGVTSNTIELDWDNEIHPRIVSYIARDLGLNIREGDLVQFANMKKEEAR